MRPDPDPLSLSPEQRPHELARILARGLLRLRERHISGQASDPGNCEKTGQNCLEVGPEKRLSVHTG
jgi:hypothetical protein